MQVVNTLCDMCYAGDQSEEPATETVTLAVNKRATENDLCEKHVEMLNTLVEPFFVIGRRPGNLVLDRPNKRRSIEDFECEQCTRTFGTLQGLAMHRTRAHGILSQTSGAQRKRALAEGSTQALPDGMTLEEATDTIDRGDCIYDKFHGPFRNRASVASHLRGVHGVSLKSLGVQHATGKPPRTA